MEEGIGRQLPDRVDSLMITIPGGEEIIRDFRDDQKWISSDSTMSRAGMAGCRYGVITDIGWYQENADGHIHSVWKKMPNPPEAAVPRPAAGDIRRFTLRIWGSGWPEPWDKNSNAQ